MKAFWMIVAAVCGVTAVVLAFRRDFDNAFIVAAAGAIAWFLNYRVQMKEMLAKNEENNEVEEIDEEE